MAAVLGMLQCIGQVPWLWNVPRGDHNCHRCTKREKELIKQIREHSQPASQYHWFFVCKAQQRFRIKRGWVLEGWRVLVPHSVYVCHKLCYDHPSFCLSYIYIYIIYTPPKWDNVARRWWTEGALRVTTPQTEDEGRFNTLPFTCVRSHFPVLWNIIHFVTLIKNLHSASFLLLCTCVGGGICSGMHKRRGSGWVWCTVGLYGVLKIEI